MLQKKLFLRHLENEKLIFFVQRRWKLPLETLFAIARYTHVHNMWLLSQTIRWLGSWPSSSFLKAMQLRNIEGHLWGQSFKRIAVFQVYWFQWKLGYIKRQNVNDFPFFHSFEFLRPDSRCARTAVMTVCFYVLILAKLLWYLW